MLVSGSVGVTPVEAGISWGAFGLVPPIATSQSRVGPFPPLNHTPSAAWPPHSATLPPPPHLSRSHPATMRRRQTTRRWSRWTSTDSPWSLGEGGSQAAGKGGGDVRHQERQLGVVDPAGTRCSLNMQDCAMPSAYTPSLVASVHHQVAAPPQFPPRGGQKTF